MNYKILSVLTFIIAVIPAMAFAQTTPPPFRVLVGIPGIDANTASIGEYINALYILSISIAALLAVIKIIIAGVKYMLSDVVTSKADAKSDIQGALIGLLIVISAAVILETVNPQLRVMNVFLDPAAQAPGRPVRDTPTQNGAAPLPGVVDGDVEVTACSTAEQCTAAADSCYARNGNIVSSRTNRSQVTCSFGLTETISCATVTDGEMSVDCNSPAVRNQCPTGSTFTPGENVATCFTPNPPRPTAEPTPSPTAVGA